MDRRLSAPGKSSPLPAAFLKMVSEVFASNFSHCVEALTKLKKAPTYFEVTGQVYPDEVLVCISLLSKGGLSASTVYASVDFDPKASSPTIQDLLAACVDAAGAVFGQVLTEDPKRLEQLASDSLSALEDVPFEWTPIEVEKRPIYVRMDKANPKLDQLADEWLKKNDPKIKEREKKEQEEVEKLFVTGDKAKKNPGTIH